MKDGFVKVAAATPAIQVADCTGNAARILELIHQDIKEMPGVAWTKTLYVLSTIKNDVSVLPEQLA